MALAFIEVLRDNRLDEITTLLDFDTGAAEIRGYNGTRPATGDTPTTLLFDMLMSTTSFPAGSSGAMTANSLPLTDAAAVAGGTATWFRIVDGNDVFVLDGDIGTSGADLNLNTVTITIGVQVQITGFTITAGNP